MATTYNQFGKRGIIRLFVNENHTVSACQTGTKPADGNDILDFDGNIVLQTTTQLKKNDKVTVKISGTFFGSNIPLVTYFEGRLVSVISE